MKYIKKKRDTSKKMRYIKKRDTSKQKEIHQKNEIHQ